MTSVPDGLVVRIRRSHRRGPGLIPGQGTSLLNTLSTIAYIGDYHVENESDGEYHTIHIPNVK